MKNFIKILKCFKDFKVFRIEASRYSRKGILKVYVFVGFKNTLNLKVENEII